MQFYALTPSVHSVRQFGVDEALKKRESRRQCRFQLPFPVLQAGLLIEKSAIFSDRKGL